MKGLIWNCRGIKKKSVSSFLKNLISEHNFHFIGIQETMVENIDDITLKGFDPNSNYLWKWIPSRGKSGGLLSGINTEFLDVGGFCEGKYILQLDVWDKHLKQKWNFLNVYRATQLEHKNEFLAELARFCCKNNQPHLIGGDFNIIRFSSDKNKPSGVHKHTDLFNNIISTYELLDMHLVGGKYTWSNNQENPTLERLDRILISKQWENLFPTAFLYKLPREISDHNPLILSNQYGIPNRKISFKFENSWLKDQEFKSLVAKIWNKPCYATSALERIQKKLKRFKQYFKGWGFNRQCEQKKKKRYMQEELLVLEQFEEEAPLLQDQMLRKSWLISELFKISEEEELYWNKDLMIDCYMKETSILSTSTE